MVVHIYNPSERLRQEDYEFQTRLGYLERRTREERKDRKVMEGREGEILRGREAGR